MAEQPPTRHGTQLPSGRSRAAVWGIALLAAFHSFLIMLWVMPVNPIRDAVGQERLAKYINDDLFPFEQSWSVFGAHPPPRRRERGHPSLHRRPEEWYRPLTNWFDITTDEDAQIKYLVNPARIHSATRRLGGNINTSIPKLTEQQRLLLRGEYVETSPTALYKRLVELNPTPAGRASVAGYAQNEEMVLRFATMYATARWGEGVSMIQYRVGHRSVPNYSKRRDANFLDVPFTYYTFGFRKAIPAPNGTLRRRSTATWRRPPR